MLPVAVGIEFGVGVAVGIQDNVGMVVLGSAVVVHHQDPCISLVEDSIILTAKRVAVDGHPVDTQLPGLSEEGIGILWAAWLGLNPLDREPFSQQSLFQKRIEAGTGKRSLSSLAHTDLGQGQAAKEMARPDSAICVSANQ